MTLDPQIRPSSRARVLSIAPGAPFLPTLVDALVNGKLVDGFAPGTNPLALADVTIWVPTRRAARSLASEFVSRLDGEAALLPQILALGDVDEDQLDATYFKGGTDGDEASLDASPTALERHLVLARLTAAWSASLNPQQREIYDGADIIMPSSMADAVRFAADLARLMDMVSTEEVSWDALSDLVPQDYAQWWQLTLEFLKIAISLWPAVLAERGQADGASARAKRLRAQADMYADFGSRGPVIAAGSTGSIPATAHLLKTIAHLPMGAVVLPGLDRDIDPETWEKIDLPDNPIDEGGTAPAHPQFGLRKLLRYLEVDRGDVHHLGSLDANSAGFVRLREELVSAAMRPSRSTQHWQTIFEAYSPEQRSLAFGSVSLVEAPGEREEALAIALALRETLARADATAALVTPDRNLARRVAVEMRRFGLEIDDSAGLPLRNRRAGSFVRLVIQAAFGAADPIVWIGLIKHPLALFGDSAARARTAARVFELVVLRGALIMPRPGTFEAAARERHGAVSAGNIRVPRSVRRLTPQDWEDGFWLAQQLDAIFSKSDGSDDTPKSFHRLAALTAGCLEACGRDANGELTHLYDGEDGQALYDFLGAMMDQREEIATEPSQWPEIFDALIAAKMVRPLSGSHPRVAILGPLEARLQTFDRIVLGGLNERTWPAETSNDPFLSRPMKLALGLPPPERRTGLAAHDFQVLLGMNDVVLTRSLRADNAPTVASRWVQRVTTLAGEAARLAMVDRGQKFLDWAQAIDQPSNPPRPCAQPRPTPPVASRPTGLSITEIETWIRDPYAIYAKRILKLDALDDLVREPDAREKGTLYHTICEAFVKQAGFDAPRDRAHDLDLMMRIARAAFAQSALPEEIQALWWPRFQEIAEGFIAWHAASVETISGIATEVSGRAELPGTGFQIRGRADRIDVLNNGNLVFIDYKTGTTPSIKQMRSGLAPQLPLEAAMAFRGAFGPSLAAHAERMEYVRLRPQGGFKVDQLAGSAKEPDLAVDTAEDNWERLQSLVVEYQRRDQPYVSKARFIEDREWASDYDHLARVREWSVGEDGDDT